VKELNYFFFRGEWKNVTPVWMCGRSIRNSVVGIVGCGNIGTSIAKKLNTFEISQLLYTSRTEKPAGKCYLIKGGSYSVWLVLTYF